MNNDVAVRPVTLLIYSALAIILIISREREGNHVPNNDLSRKCLSVCAEIASGPLFLSVHVSMLGRKETIKDWSQRS